MATASSTRPVIRAEAPIRQVEVSAYTIPTETPAESDGTLSWKHTTLVLVEVSAGDRKGLGWSYADPAAARLIRDTLAPVVTGQSAFDIPACWSAMTKKIRNLGRPGISSMAIAAVDNALWDLKARLLDVALVSLLGGVRQGIPIYGSGGFTDYSIEQLQAQLSGWVEQGITSVKLKVGTHPEDDVSRVASVREAIGDQTALYVDANGAYSRKQALAMAEAFHENGVTWFEEPVSSDDLEGLRLVRDHAPAGMNIAAGEYGYDLYYFRRMMEAGAVDVLQVDSTRCAGISGFMSAASLCEAFGLPLSAHTAPSIHAHACCAAKPAYNLEYFFDHFRIENMLFEGVLQPVQGMLSPDLCRPGLGLQFKRADAEVYRVPF